MRFFLALLLLGLPVAAQTAQPVIKQPGQLADTMSAPPLTPHGKFSQRVVEQFAIRGLIGNAIGAGFSQWTDTPGEWGRGWTGYADRFASGFGQTLTRQSVAWTIENIVHTDPRYFPSTEPGFKPRFLNAVKQIYLAKRDDGSTGIAYGKLISAFAAGQVVNTWEPPSNNSVSDGLERGVITLGVDGVENLVQEIFTFARPKSLRHRQTVNANP